MHGNSEVANRKSQTAKIFHCNQGIINFFLFVLLVIEDIKTVLSQDE